MRHVAWSSGLGLGVTLLCAAQASAAPALRVQVDQHGDFVLFGNTLGQECAAGTPAPVVGTVGNCGTNLGDSAPDVFWRSQDPGLGQALADTGITVAQARSTAILQIPNGATITYARLYWGAMLPADAADQTVTLDRPGGFTADVTADASFRVAVPGSATDHWYQSTALVTDLVVNNGVGAYRVSGVDSYDLRNQNNANPYAAWAMVVFYQLASDPPRNLALFDGLDMVQNGAPAAVSLSGFLVPNAGFDAKLGVVTYEGDETLPGDQLLFNGAVLSDAQNPATNFFNATRSYLGAAVSVAGDLPQLTGGPGSMSGVDLDVVDIKAQLKSGDTTAQIQATSTQDRYLLAAWVTSISTFKPDLSTTGKTLRDVNGGALLPGDEIEYTIASANTGNDTAVGTVLNDPLPAQVAFVPGSIRITAGANQGSKTDATGDDQGEYLAGSRTVRVRLGVGANATQGGSLAPGASTTVVFRVMVDAGASGTISNQAIVTASGQQGAPPDNYPTDGNGGKPGTPPTDTPIDHCAVNDDCSAPTPVCDTTQSPHACVQCLSDTVCTSSLVCDELASKTCVECTQTKLGNCSALSNGVVCLGDNTCGCATDSDCGAADSGRVCDDTTKKCAIGCRGTGGNSCAAGLTCTSSDTRIGRCVAADGGAGGSAGVGGAGGRAGAGGQGGFGGQGGQWPPADGGSPAVQDMPGSLEGAGCACSSPSRRSSWPLSGALSALFSLILAARRWRRRD